MRGSEMYKVEEKEKRGREMSEKIKLKKEWEREWGIKMDKIRVVERLVSIGSI